MEPAALQKKKVLVIDDNESLLSAIGQALEIKGYEVLTSEGYMELEKVAAFLPDMIYLDMSLPGKDGREVARELKSSERTKHIPIIILTGYPEAKEMAQEAGADGYLSKPFELAQLWELTAAHTADTK